MPTQNEEPLMAYTWTGTATAVTWKPTNETPCPTNSRRYGWRMVHAVGPLSTAIRRAGDRSRGQPLDDPTIAGA